MEKHQNPTTLIANWNGQFMPLTEVKVSVLDRGFLFGDAVYEVIRVYSGRLFRADDHLDRLSKSLASLDIRHVDLEMVRQRLRETVVKSDLKDALVYLQITRGEAPRTHHYPQSYTPNVLLYATPFDDPYAAERESGVAAVTHPDIRWGRNDIKATSLAANCMAAQFARERQALEVVFIDHEGYMTEGSHTSLFGIKGGKLVVAPSSPKVLPGITKRQVLELARDIDMPRLETRLKESELYGLDELFLAGTPEELIAIVRVNDKTIGNGRPGPLVRELHQAFRAGIKANLTG
jgi:D-alanine transaminase